MDTSSELFAGPHGGQGADEQLSFELFLGQEKISAPEERGAENTQVVQAQNVDFALLSGASLQNLPAISQTDGLQIQ